MDLQELRTKAIEAVKEQLRHSVHEDTLIIQASSLLEELDKTANMLVKRLREWYELHNPEFSHITESHEKFVKTILSDSKIRQKDSMGSEISKEDINAIMNLAEEVKSLYNLKETQEKYLEETMQKSCPNVKAVAGVLIGAKLIVLAGSLDRLSKFPASTIQLLGAEKALFRHLRNRRNLPPKYGILHEHSLLAKVPPKNRGKVARALGDKLAIAAKVDVFKGKFIGNVLMKQLEKKVEDLKQ